MNIRSTIAVLTLLGGALSTAVAEAPSVSSQQMQAIYDEVKTPFKYGVIITPPEGKLVDCPCVIRHGDKWYMSYVEFEPKPAEGYTTQFAESSDLLHWKPLGTLLNRGPDGAWDHANVGGSFSLFDTKWGGSNEIGTYDGRYWLSYLGGSIYGYEQFPLSISLASAKDPITPSSWEKLPAPVLGPSDADVRPTETTVLYRSYIFHDDAKTLGAPFVMFYNARGTHECIFTAISDDMKTWKRYGSEAVIDNPIPEGSKRITISGDPEVVKINGTWVMFYFGAFWKPGAFDTFAASPDLVHWTKWTGEDLVKNSELYDTPYAHKPWVLKYNGVVYHFYCAVDAKHHRTIALATSKDMK